MIAHVDRPGRAARVRRSRAARPSLEGLEGRLLLYTPTGDHFAYASRITWSIMPDGTNLGGVSSNLVATLNQELGAGVWEQSLSDAFAQWESFANVNVVQVPDDGAPFDSGNTQQGSPEYGDIRIGGFAQYSGVLAFTMLPPANNGGSDAGDIFFNTAQPWHINSDYDFETVAIHEVGHSVGGLGESSVPQAAEYMYYDGIKQGLAPDDVAGIQALWGPRAEDPIEQATNNLTPQNAATCNYVINGADQVILPGLDVASPAEQYWFKVTTPANASNVLTAQVQSSNLSELSPRVAIFDANVRSLTQAIAPATSYGATVAASIVNATPNTTYYIKVLGSNGGVTGSGGYGLTLNMGTQPIAAIPAPYTTVAAQPDQGGYGLFQLTGGAFGGDSWKRKFVEEKILNELHPRDKDSSDPSKDDAAPHEPAPDVAGPGTDSTQLVSSSDGPSPLMSAAVITAMPSDASSPAPAILIDAPDHADPKKK